MLKPPPKLTISEWADAERYLSPEASAEPGRWDTSRAEYLREIMDAVGDPLVTRVVVTKAAQVGWALALDTPLPTPSGWTTMAEVRAGDTLFDESGAPCRVTFVTTVMRDHRCFRVVFSDGESIVADADHRWFVESDSPLGGRFGPRSGVLTTDKIAATARFRGSRNRYAVPVAKPLQTEAADLLIDPFVLGVWLGDGHLYSANFTMLADDAAIVSAEFAARGYVCFEKDRTSTGVLTVGIRLASDDREFCSRAHDMRDTGRTKAGYCAECARQDSSFNQRGKPRDEPRPRDTFSARLTQLGVLGTHKHIPTAYLRASYQQRLALLQGLMDTDGHITKQGRAEFVGACKALVDDVVELTRTLGLKPTKVYRPARGQDAEQWRVSFLAYNETPIARLPRKLERQKEECPACRSSETRRRRIVAVEPVESVPVRCVTVDSPSHLYLAGRGMIPTHNTEVINNAAAFYMTQDPAPILVIQPTIEMAEAWSKDRLAPMLRDTPALRGRIRDPRSRDSGNTILQKLFPGGHLTMIGANAPAGLASRPIRIVLADEVNRYPVSAGTEGDPLALAAKRQTTFWNRKTLIGSTPTVKGLCAITREFEASDQRRFHVPCPHCGTPQVLRWERVKWAKVTEDGSVAYDMPDGQKGVEHRPETACYACEGDGCGALWTDPERWDAVQHGTWVAEKPFAGVAGFHIPGFLSSWLKLEEIVREFLKVKGDPSTLQVWVNTVLGDSWEESGEKVDGDGLIGRTEAYDGETLPAAIQAITAGVDTQGDRLEAHLIAWGPREEAWPFLYQVIHGDPAQPQVWKELDEVLLSTFKTEDGRSLRVRAACLDTGGHHGAQVLNYTKSRRTRRVFAIKGASGPRPVWPMRASKAKTNDQLFIIGVDTAKDAIYSRLRIDQPGPGYIHFPAADGFDERYFDQLTSEQAVTRHKEGRPYRVWTLLKGRRNEVLDTFVYALAALKALGLRLEKMPMPEIKPDGSFEHKVSLQPASAVPPPKRDAPATIDLGRIDLKFRADVEPEPQAKAPLGTKKRRSTWL